MYFFIQLHVVSVYFVYNANVFFWCIMKIKVTLEQATKAQRGSKSIGLLFL